MDTLILNANYRPKAVVPWQKAVELVFREVVYTVATYEDWVVRSPSTSILVPAVLALKKYIDIHQPVRFTRTNVYLRDNYACQYCGASVLKGTLLRAELTFDHVVPRYHGGITKWTNIVTACKVCNLRKANRTPKEAGMPLLSKPYAPMNLSDIGYGFAHKKVPEPWKEFLPKPIFSESA